MYSISDLNVLIKKNKNKKTIVFPEGTETEIVQVANKIIEEELANVILLYNNKNEIPSTLNSKIKTYIVGEVDKSMVNLLMEIRKGKITEEEALNLVTKRNYFGALLVKLGEADCMVCGLSYTTADTLRPTLQIIKTSDSYSIASSVLILSKDEEQIIFTDCALNVDPSPRQLAEISVMAANFAKDMNVKDVQVSLLSYSTNSSGSGQMVEKVKEAVNILNEKTNNDFIFDGEMQFDSAYVKKVRDKKYSGSKITKEKPDVMVFPDLNSGNIGYKIAQRMGGYKASGPFILGLNKPVNDLSRGATFQDIYETSIVTLFQALQRNGEIN